MRLVWLVVSVALLIPLSGSHRPNSQPELKTFSESSDLYELRQQALTSYRRADYQAAIAIFARGAEEAKNTGQTHSAAFFRFQLGSSYFRLLNYRRAMDAYMESAELAEQAGDEKLLTRVWLNVSSLYDHLGDSQAAETAAERGLRYAHPAFLRERARLLVQLGIVQGNLGDAEAGMKHIREGIESAQAAGEEGILAMAWDHLGAAYLLAGRTDAAQEAFTRGREYATRSGTPREHLSFMYFGMVAQAERRHEEAVRQFGLAEQVSVRERQPIPLRAIYTLRGESFAALGQWERSLEDFQRSISWIRRLREDVLPADSVRIGMESELSDRSYAGALTAALELYQRNGSRQFLQAAFEASEENKAHSLRQALRSASQIRKTLPDAYWPALARLHAAEVALLGEDSAPNREAARLVQTVLTELETRAGLQTEASTEPGAGGNLLRAVQRALRKDEVYFSFHLGEARSWLWAVNRSGVGIYSLPPLSRIEPLAGRFRHAVHSGGPELDQTGEELYHALFGKLPVGFKEAPNWLLGLDTVLFEIPFPVLPIGSGDSRGYLIEKHSLRIVPGAVFLKTGSSRPLDGDFLGVGDPIYNRADSRWTGGAVESNPRSAALPSRIPWMTRTSGGVSGFEMARLPGSARELDACARYWRTAGRKAEILLGPDVERTRVREALQNGAGILHFATHFVESRQKPVSGLIALSLRPDGQPQFLGAAEIRMLHPSAQLVVLSGCASGSADVLPASGLLGLTRAWLLSGSDAVAASQWPTADDSGIFFLEMYGHLAQPGQPDVRRAAAISLQQAQIRMIRSGSWRAAPKYWGAYFLVSKG